MNLAVEIELNLRIIYKNLFKIANYISLNSKQENEN